MIRDSSTRPDNLPEAIVSRINSSSRVPIARLRYRTSTAPAHLLHPTPPHLSSIIWHIAHRDVRAGMHFFPSDG